METITSLAGMEAASRELRRGGRTIAVVPTMGYLHAGHTSLIALARTLADAVVTTIFVNPTQFGPGEDFERYPRDLGRDATLASGAGTDILFVPDVGEMYPQGYRTFVEVEGLSSVLEGAVRPSHFRGVTTVVTKLFMLVRPDVALFGQKDAQQAFIVRRMTADLNFGVRIVVAPIIREADGLALSSRNVYLSPDERARAVVLSQALRHAEGRVRGGERSAATLREEMTRIITGGRPTGVDYIAFVSPETFREVDLLASPGVCIACAVRFGTTRLIDNTIIDIEPPEHA